MKPKFMPYVPFNQSLVGKETLYIFPLPNGPRCLYTTDGKTTYAVTENGDDITGFAPDVETALIETYLKMFSEPNPRYTENGVQVHFPKYCFDVVLHDRVSEIMEDGTAEKTMELLDEWEDLGVPADNGAVRAVVLASFLEDEYKAGRTKSDIWWNRAHHKRGMVGAGYGRQADFPKPAVGWLEIASRFKDSERSGIAVDTIDDSWDYMFNVFARKHYGVLIVDVWAGWNINGKAFRVMREEDIEI